LIGENSRGGEKEEKEEEKGRGEGEEVDIWICRTYSLHIVIENHCEDEIPLIFEVFYCFLFMMAIHNDS
jgi:hypothetical protein